jgi:putative flippase GtrA
LLGRHQVAAAAATTADFSAMIALVELGHRSPPIATLASAILGGVINFTLSRAWVYRARHEGTIGSQASRYAVVSLGGALLNAGLLAMVLASVQAPYPAARVVTAVAVSVLYTYPMHTRVVFRVAP